MPNEQPCDKYFCEKEEEKNEEEVKEEYEETNEKVV